MLAYVFWHRPAAGVGRGEYEHSLVDFHRALATAPPAGFARSFAHRYERLSWLGDSGPGYEDWYLVDDWTAVGTIESGAVSGSRRAPHDRVAAASADGVGAVYGLVAGAPEALAAGGRAWFDKPDGMSYRELDDLLAPQPVGGEACLWRRRLVLGPAPENCLVGAPGIAPPGELGADQAAGEVVHSTWS